MTASETSKTPSLLVVSGLTELAVGALTGWVYTAVKTKPEAMQELGIREPDRIRQWHLDLTMLGAYTAVCGMAVPAAPRSISMPLAIGAWANAFAFLPLAFRPDLHRRPAFVAAMVGSFVATSIGFAGTAHTAYRRYRRR